MKILIINGPNLNMLGVREKALYGENSYKSLIKTLKIHCKKVGVKARFFQSNIEGKIVTKIQKAYNRFDGILINPGAYTHTSVAILDALKAVNIKTVEVHLTDVDNREEFRKISYVSLFAEKKITGKGIDGYIEGINHFVK